MGRKSDDTQTDVQTNAQTERQTDKHINYLYYKLRWLASSGAP